MEEFKIGTYIRKQRELLQLSQEELCEGYCSVSTLSRIENNQQDPSRSLTKNLLERLGLPQDKFTAFWGQKDLTAGTLMREINNDMVLYRQILGEGRRQLREQILEKLEELGSIVTTDDKAAQQFLIAQKASLGGPDGPYSMEEKLSMQLEAIRLTCPRFNLEDFRGGHYNREEYLLITQIAKTYSSAGQKERAIDIYRQLLWYIEKNGRELAGYASQFCLVAHNYAINLLAVGQYMKAIDVAEKGRKTCIEYGTFQFLPGLIAVQAESNYYLGQEETSRNLYRKAYYLYEAFEDKVNREIMRKEMKAHLGMEIDG